MGLFGNGLTISDNFYVVVGTSNSATTDKIFLSENNLGDNFVKANNPGFNTLAQILAVVYNGTLWVAGGARLNSSSSTGNNLIYSTDGKNWNFASITTSFINNISWNGSLFIATPTGGSTYYTSIDGINWISRTTLSTIFVSGGIQTKPIWFSNKWYLGGFAVSGSTLGRIASSSDGITWTQVYSVSGLTPYSLGANGNSQIVSTMGTTGAIYSADGTTWASGTVPVGFNFSFAPPSGKIVWAGNTINQYILSAVSGDADNRLLSSPDGINWVPINTTSIFGSSTTTFTQDLNWDGTNVWMTRQGGATAAYPGTVFRTTDLTNWTAVLDFNTVNARSIEVR